jgi:hypothetical protein
MIAGPCWKTEKKASLGRVSGLLTHRGLRLAEPKPLTLWISVLVRLCKSEYGTDIFCSQYSQVRVRIAGEGDLACASTNRFKYWNVNATCRDIAKNLRSSQAIKNYYQQVQVPEKSCLPSR